eukprot:Pgem_evm1s17178
MSSITNAVAPSNDPISIPTGNSIDLEKPQLDEPQVKTILEQFWSLPTKEQKILEIKSIPSYDDQNFLITIGDISTKEETKNERKCKFVFKISHSGETLSSLHLQHDLMFTLKEKSVSVPTPKISVN